MPKDRVCDVGESVSIISKVRTLLGEPAWVGTESEGLIRLVRNITGDATWAGTESQSLLKIARYKKGDPTWYGTEYECLNEIIRSDRSLPSWDDTEAWSLKEWNSLWTPIDEPGLITYCLSDQGVTKDELDRMSLWSDQGEEGNDFAQTTDSKKPIWTPDELDGYPGIIFDGVDDLMYGGTSWPAVMEYYLIMKQIGWTHNRYVSGESVTAWAHLISQQNPSPSLALYHNGADWACHNDELAVGNYGLVQALFNGANSLIRVNGGTPTTGNPGNTLTAGAIGIGGKYSDGSGANISLVAFIGYDHGLSDEVRAKMENWAHTRCPSLWT